MSKLIIPVVELRLPATAARKFTPSYLRHLKVTHCIFPQLQFLQRLKPRHSFLDNACQDSHELPGLPALSVLIYAVSTKAICSMARRKQAAPVQRQPSDFDRGPLESPDHGWKTLNGNGHIPNGTGNAVLERTKSAMSDERPKEPSPLHALEQPGMIQLIVCVAGIYASL